jgi:hypothetical protein
MKVGEIWRYKHDGCIVRITKIWQDEPEDRDLMVAVEPLNEDADDTFADYFRDRFIVEFERVYDEMS